MGVRILTLTHTVFTYLMLCASNLWVLPMSVAVVCGGLDGTRNDIGVVAGITYRCCDCCNRGNKVGPRALLSEESSTPERP